MKWLWLMVLGVLLPLLVLGVFGAQLYHPGLPIAAQENLDRYLSEQFPRAETVRVQEIKRAAHPQALTAEASKARYGDEYYFGSNGRPPPFPPTEAWCVTLAPSSSKPFVVVVAQHEDMYVGAWFVHEPAGGAVEAICR